MPNGLIIAGKINASGCVCPWHNNIPYLAKTIQTMMLENRHVAQYLEDVADDLFTRE